MGSARGKWGARGLSFNTTLDAIRRMRDKGITIVVVEHNMRAIMSLCDRIVVLSFGKKIAEGLPKEIGENKDVIEAYLGSEIS